MSHANDVSGANEWIMDLHESPRSFGAGGEYVNNQTDTEEERVRAAFGENFDCFAEVTAKWGPDDGFRSRQHIEPEAKRVTGGCEE